MRLLCHILTASIAVEIMNLKNFFLFCVFSIVSLSAWTEEKNYYKTLDVSRTATQTEIKTAYKKLAQKWHPDKHPSEEKDKAKEKFQEIKTAYDTLKDPQKRQRYDQFGHQNWTSSEQAKTQTGDFYSETFKDILIKQTVYLTALFLQKAFTYLKT